MSLARRALERFRTALAIKAFLRHELTPLEALARTQSLLQEREKGFLTVLRDAVYTSRRGAYFRLLQHAGITLDDVVRDIEGLGLEGALGKLYDAGVYVTLEEFKGRAPIRREGLEIPVDEVDLSNPLAGDSVSYATGGSRGAPSYSPKTFDRITLDVGAFAYSSFYTRGYMDRPFAEWRQGEMYWPIFYAKIGKRMVRSFSTLDYSLRTLGLGKYLGDRLMRSSARLIGIPVIRSEYVPAGDAIVIARWLAELKLRGTPAVIHTTCSSAVRLCLAARENGLDIAGTAMSVTGEPYTPAKARIVASVGVELEARYSSVELGMIGRACAAPVEVDEVHLNADRVALVQRARLAAGGGVSGLFFTGVQPFFPKVMINVEIGDYATVFERDCGCPCQEMGLSTHLSNIRSYEKLTSEGVTFLGGELIDLVEEVLPEQFGGRVGDFQLAEDEEEGTTRINIIVSPSVGHIDEAAVIETVLEALAAETFGDRRRMGEIWQGGNVLKVVRREPLQTGRAKVLPLHVIAASRTNADAAKP